MMIFTIAKITASTGWLIVFFWFYPSAVRSFISNKFYTPNAIWSVSWFFSILQLGYAARRFYTWSYHPELGGDLSSAIGLQVMSALLAFYLIKQRWSFRNHV